MKSTKGKSKPQPPAEPSTPLGERPGLRLRLWISLALALITFLVFIPTFHNDFVNYDDPDYVTSNSYVQSGLSVAGITWAFTTGHASNWHPLTWISHMIDWGLFGKKASGHHLVSLLFHIANTVILFLFLQNISRALWPSAVVAALFALHPCHVESVAWVSERKDVLSALFGLLSMWAYVHYVEARSTTGEAGHQKRWYMASLFLFVLGLMSKPMLVTLPFLLLLLDYWPLGRFFPEPMKRFPALLLEKIPFLLFSLASSVITFVVQRKGGAVSTSVSLTARIENAIVAYGRYVRDLFWPDNLAVLYPHPGKWPALEVWLSALFLILVTGVTLYSTRKRPYLLMGWFWFLGSLVPVIGLVQVGVQSMADRYTYLPFIGLFIMVVFGCNEALTRFLPRPVGAPGTLSVPQATITALVMIPLALLAMATRQQIGYWKSSESLFRHAAAVTTGNYLAHNNLGFYLSNRGDTAGAIESYREALKIKPDYEDALNNMGYALAGQKHFAEAIEYYERALRIRPNHVEVHNNLGNALSDLGRVDEAIPHYEFVLKEKPNHADAHNNYGVVLAMKGQFDKAIEHFHAALKYRRDYASAHSNLGNTYAMQHKLDQAIAEYHQSIELNPDDPQAHNNLGNVLAEQGKVTEAISEYTKALKLNTENPEAHFNLAMMLLRSSQKSEAAAHFREAIRLKPDYGDAQNQLRLLNEPASP